MIPTQLIHLTELPLTLSGKLNRHALPKPSFSNAKHYVAPKTELEKKLCALSAEGLLRITP